MVVGGIGPGFLYIEMTTHTYIASRSFFRDEREHDVTERRERDERGGEEEGWELNIPLELYCDFPPDSSPQHKCQSFPCCSQVRLPPRNSALANIIKAHH
jgi:hypothetical protein